MNTTSTIVRRASAYVVLSFVGAMPVPAQTQPQVSDYHVAGIHVIQKQVTANDVIAMRLFLKGGAAAITSATAGIEEMIAESITKGTEKYSKDDFAALATSTGTEVGGSTSLDYTSFFAQGVRQNLDAMWDLFTQAALHPTFPEEEVAQVRDQMINELKQRTDHPDSYLNVVADSLLYLGHPYAVRPQGTEAAVAKLGREDLARWHKQRMTKENLLLVVVGNVSRAELEPRIAAAFGSLPATGGAPRAVPPLTSSKSTISVIERKLPTNYIMGLYPAAGRGSPDFPALMLATRVLGERLFEEVRTKRNLTYAVGAGLSGARQSRGNLYVTTVSPDTTIKVIFNEVRKIQREPVSASRLGETKNVYTTGYWMSQETNMGQAQTLGFWELTGGGWRNARLFVDRVRAVTPADVQRVANKYYKNARFVVIGDPSKVNQTIFTTF